MKRVIRNNGCYVGIDPGSKGAVAFFWPADRIIQIEDIPTIKRKGTKRTFTTLDGLALYELLEQYNPEKAFVESVHSMPGDGAVGAFTFGQNFGGICAALDISQIPVDYIAPNIWKASMNLSNEKKLSKILASKLFPDYTKSFSRSDRAEALLICLYGVLSMGIKISKD